MEMTQKEMAEKAKVSPSFLSDIINRRRPCSKKMAVKLAEITGTNRLQWLYPDEFDNPLMKAASK